VKLARDYAVKNEGSLGRRGAVIQAVLHYLIKNPDAKDTIDGVRRWWLPEGYREQRKEELEEILDSLASKHWLTIRMTSQQKKIYGLNKDFLEQVKIYLKDTVDDE
jgi:hypothetical protein